VIAGHGSPIGEKGPLVIAALVAHGSRAKAAAAAGVHVDTIKRWLADPDFRAEYEAAKKVCVEEAHDALRGAMWGSVALLVAFRDDESKADSLRRQCAVDILTLAKPAIEDTDLAEKLAKLEANLEMVKHEFHY
jgi:hypothetical protein